MDYHALFSLNCCFQKQSFRSHDINIAPLCESEILIFNGISYSKRDAAGDVASFGYYNLYPTTFNMTQNGSDFSGWLLHTIYMIVIPLGTSPFLINLIVFVALTRLSISLAILPS